MDADLATPLDYIAEAINALDKYDIVIGVRNLARIHKGFRALVSLGANWLTRLLVLRAYQIASVALRPLGLRFARIYLATS